ncbi:MAG: acetyl-CoA carboxylase biotin carboxyl carrier protein [Pseudomonadales bacterium]
MDLRKIKKLIELVEESGITELEVSSGDEAVRIARPQQAAAPGAVVAQPVRNSEPSSNAGDSQTAQIEVRAPMAGTFYVAPEPGASAYVQPGETLPAEAVVCIIESMKMMNEIRLSEAGECIEVLVADGEPVSAQQQLFRFRSNA